MRKIVITGPESSGKTTLAKSLAQHYTADWVPEYSRTYLTQISRPYVYEDLLKIAKGQLDREQTYDKGDNSYLFCDTSMLVMKVWSIVRFQKVDPWIVKQLKSPDYCFYLLCSPDIPWEYDPLRENPEDRPRLFNIYLNTLKTLKLPYAIIEGIEQEKRLKTAVETLKRHFDSVSDNRQEL